MRASTVPTGTVSPALTRMSSSVPSYGLGNLRIHLVGRHVEQRIVECDIVSDCLEPRADRALGHGLTQFRHGDLENLTRTGRREVGILGCRALRSAHRRRGGIVERSATGRGHPVCGRRESVRHRGALPADLQDRGADRDGVALLRQNLKDHTVVRARDLRIDLVGRYFEQRVVEFDFVADVS